MKDIHIGNENDRRLAHLRMTKTEFGRKIGVKQQNVHRILESKSIDTEKLQVISDVLGFNFFSLYVDDTSPMTIAAGDSAVAAINSDVKSIDVNVLRERLKNMELVLAEKERMIQYLLQNGNNIR